MVMCYLRERVDDIEREVLQEQISQIPSEAVDCETGDLNHATDTCASEEIPLLCQSWSPTTNSYSQTNQLKRKFPTNKATNRAKFSPCRQFSVQEARSSTSNTPTKIPPPLLSRHTQFTFDETDLRHELDTWKKAHNSMQGVTKDEKTVQKVLRRKVMALDSLLHR